MQSCHGIPSTTLWYVSVTELPESSKLRMTIEADVPFLAQAGASVLEFFGLTLVFWRKTGEVYRREHVRENEATGGRTREALKSKITWICSLFFFTYMAVEGK